MQGKRHAAVLILRELAVAMPTYFYQQVSGFFEHIFTAIRDSKSIIREGAGQALRAALVVTSQRESSKQLNKPQWYKLCFDEAIVCFAEVPMKEKGVTKDDRIHSALIILDELLRCSNANWERKYNSLRFLEPERKIHRSDDYGTFLPRFKAPFIEKLAHSSSSNTSYLYDLDCNLKYCGNIQESAACRQIITENYDDICQRILEQRTVKSSYVQQSLFSILPRLVSFNCDVFVRDHLNNTINYLLNTLRGKEKDRNQAFVTLGYIAVAVKDEIEPYLPSTFEIIKATLPSKDVHIKKKSTPDPSVFLCITLFGHAVKNEALIIDYIKDLLEPMKSTGVSQALVVSFRELAEQVPRLRNIISDGLLNMLSQVLMSKPLSQLGTPKHNITAQFASLTATDTQLDTATIVLALKTLGTFNFGVFDLLEFVQRCADYFLQHDQQEIRIEAVETCSRLLKITIHQDESDQSTIDMVNHCLNQLLNVGITDLDPNVRLRVLKSLDETFDNQLAQPGSLSALLMTLNDEVFEIRELAIQIIGRLSAKNPAFVMPSLRKTLVQLLTEIQHSGMSRNKEQSARMLDHLIVSTPRLISAYMKPILTKLVPKLKEPESNPGVILNVLRAIGDLAEVNGGSNEMERWADELLAILLEMLGDAGSPEKRGVALWTFGQLIGEFSNNSWAIKRFKFGLQPKEAFFGCSCLELFHYLFIYL